MTKEEALPILVLLSRLDGWLSSKDIPEWIAIDLSDKINELVEVVKNDT